MPVNTLHPDYEAHASDWSLMRDVVNGHKAVQKAGAKYLPKLSDQNDEEYKAYRERAPFFNATGRVVDALTGMVFRKEAKVEGPNDTDALKADITLTGIPFDQFAESVVEEVMAVNRLGVLVDYPDAKEAAGDKVVTVQVAENLGIRVYARIYRAEDIINWRTVERGGKSILSLVVLRENVEEIDAADPFAISLKVQYRVLELVGGAYRQQVWQENSSSNGRITSLTLIKESVPLKGGKPLDFIPFEFFSSEGGEPCVRDPVLYDLAIVNLAHYRNTADMEHGLHFTGLPTAVISGVNANDGDSYRIGSVTAWVFADPAAKASYLEFNGEGLKQLRQGIQDKEGQMAALGARMLAPEKRDAEASDTIAQKRQGETSSLAALANAVSRGLSRVLTMMVEWQGSNTAVTVKLNTDFLVVAMPPQQISALLQAVMTGNLSPQSFYETLVKGEVISGVRDYEEEKALIDEAGMNAPEPVDDTE